MNNQKGFVTIAGLFLVLLLLMGLASSISNKPKNNFVNEQFQNPVVNVDTGAQYQNTQYPMQSVETACNYMGGSWYQNTNTCAGNIDTNKCVQYGGRINGCDSSSRYAGSRTYYPTCETTCTFNGSYVIPNQQYQNPTYYPPQIQNPVYEIKNEVSNPINQEFCSAVILGDLSPRNIKCSDITYENPCPRAGIRDFWKSYGHSDESFNYWVNSGCADLNVYLH